MPTTTTGRSKKAAAPVRPSRTNTFGLPVEPIGVDASRIDPVYHRSHSQRAVARIAGDPDPIRAVYATYNRRADGTLVLVDGERTRAAAEANGYKFVYGRVLDQLSLEDEIALYLELNTNVSGYNRHVANVARKEPIALQIDAALAAKGLDVRSIRAIGILRSCWGAAGRWKDTSQLTKKQLAAGRARLNWVLTVLHGLVKKGDKPYDVYTLVNISAMIWLHRSATEKRPLASTLSKVMAKGTAKTLQLRLPDEYRSAHMRYGLRAAVLLDELNGTGVPLFEFSTDRD